MGDQLDPRVQEELEKLNVTSHVINDLENKLNKTRNQYRTALSDSTTQLNNLLKKLGDCVNKARPYYIAKQDANAAQLETLQAAVRFERAVSMHAAAREMVSVAEQGMENNGNQTDKGDTAWQEMLNHATVKVNEAEVERLASDVEHKQKMEAFKKAEAHMSSLQKKLKFNIMRSKKYFELKDVMNAQINRLVKAVKEAETQLVEAKQEYSQALKNLESISNSIHETRKSLGVRESGVGAEDEPQVSETLSYCPTSEILKSVDESNLSSSEPELKPRTTPTLPKKHNEVLLSVAQLTSSEIS